MKRNMFIALVVAAAVMPTFAQARPMELAANDRAHYGAPQDYTVHDQVMGVGVSEGQYRAVVGKSPDDRPFARSTALEQAPVVVTKETGWSIDVGNPAFAGLALLLGLLAGGMGVTFYNHRRSKLSPA
jgi:hypothetical protein